MAAAMVANPTEITVATRTPAMITPESQREFDLKEKLAIGQAHASSGLDYGGVNALNADVGVSNQRQQGVESERENGEAIGSGSDPGRGQQESEKGEAGDGLNNVGSAEHGFVQRGPACDRDAERNSDEHSQESRDSDQPQVLECEFENFRVVL